MERDSLTIGRAARAAGVNVDTLRFYEKRKLLPRPSRTPAGYRIYTGEVVKRVRFIRRAQELGFTLQEIAELLKLVDGHEGGSRAMCALAEKKVEILAAKISDLCRMRKSLETLIRKCPDTGPVSGCTIVESLTANGGRTGKGQR